MSGLLLLLLRPRIVCVFLSFLSLYSNTCRFLGVGSLSEEHYDYISSVQDNKNDSSIGASGVETFMPASSVTTQSSNGTEDSTASRSSKM